MRYGARLHGLKEIRDHWPTHTIKLKFCCPISN